jgi:hypothetical protein
MHVLFVSLKYDVNGRRVAQGGAGAGWRAAIAITISSIFVLHFALSCVTAYLLMLINSVPCSLFFAD